MSYKQVPTIKKISVERPAMRVLPGETYHERITWRAPFFHIHLKMPCLAAAPDFSKRRDGSVQVIKLTLHHYGRLIVLLICIRTLYIQNNVFSYLLELTYHHMSAVELELDIPNFIR